MKAALKAVYALLKGVWPTGAALLSPDDDADFETALSNNTIVVRYWQPQLRVHEMPSRFTAFVDVCSRSNDDATDAADKLLAHLDRHARSPTGNVRAEATPIPETSYHRVHVTWTLITDSN